MLRINELKVTPSLELFSELVELLQDAVGSGGVLGYTAVPSTKEARNYWAGVLEDVGRGRRQLFVATDEHVCAGSIQLARTAEDNGKHRGHVEKLMVHTQFRRRGIAGALLGALEAAAAGHGLSLLVLEVRQDDGAEALYRKHGWLRVGSIPGFERAPGGALVTTAVYYRAVTPAQAR